jgi:hypothetical protein
MLHLDPQGAATPLLSVPRPSVLLLRDPDTENPVGTVARFMSGWCVISTVVSVGGEQFVGMELLETEPLRKKYGLPKRSREWTWLSTAPEDETFELNRRVCTIYHSGAPVLRLKAVRMSSPSGHPTVKFFALPVIAPMGALQLKLLDESIEVSFNTAANKIKIPRKVLERMTNMALTSK